MAILFIGVDTGDLLHIEDIGAMSANELGIVEDLFEITHRFIFQEGAVMGMDLYIIVGGFQVMNVFHGDDLYFASGLDYDPVLLSGRMGGSLQ